MNAITPSRLLAVLTAGAFLAAAAGGPTLADAATVRVTLWDKGPSSLDRMGQGPGMGMDMPGAQAPMATLGIKADRDSVPAGEVTFEVANRSKDIVHEMVVAPADPAGPLPYDAEEQGVKEDAVHSLGEVSELDPGASGSVKLNLTPGKYILFCKVSGHYMLGMWTLLTVTG